MLYPLSYGGVADILPSRHADPRRGMPFRPMRGNARRPVEPAYPASTGGTHE
jgi:hypothetical protein